MSFFSIITNVTKASVAICAAPIALIADVCTLPDSAEDWNRGPFDRTGKILTSAGECIIQAIKPDRN